MTRADGARQDGLPVTPNSAEDAARQTTLRSMLSCLSPRQLDALADINEAIRAAAKARIEGAPMIESDRTEPASG